MLVYGMACTFLFYMQSIQPLDYNNRYFQSDLPYHISMIIDDGWYYSFTAYVYQILYLMGGKGPLLIALFLGGIALGTCVLTERMLCLLLQKKEKSTATGCMALLLQFVMPFYLPFAGQYRYVSYQAGNIWHNSTYLCMRFLGILAVLLYLNLEEEYKTKLEGKKLVLFSVVLFVCTGVKPSFLTVFAPIMALKLLWDLLHKVSFKNIFVFGCTVLPSCGVVLWQNLVLFGEDTGNGVTFSPWQTFCLHADRPKLAVILSLAFPLIVLFSLLLSADVIQKIGLTKKDLARVGFFWMMAILGFLIALCFVETGKRERDGNFIWGYSIGIFLLQNVSMVLVWLQGKKWKDEIFSGKIRSLIYRGMFVAQVLVLTYQSYCGIYFFWRLLMGETYFMTK